MRERTIQHWRPGFRHQAVALLWAAVVSGILSSACSPSPTGKIIIIGGTQSEGPGRHDYPDGVRALATLVEASPDTRGVLQVLAYPDGWPDDPRVFDEAGSVIWYFDGADKHPLQDPKRRASFDAAMRRGVGLVTLHQSSTVSPGDDLSLQRWLGGVRVGTFDRTTEWTQVMPADETHPVARGVRAFDYRDEFYPTFELGDTGKRTAILKAELHPQFRDGRYLIEDRAEETELAWAFEREGGGRSFVFSGAHYLHALHRPEVARVLLNAILWTSGNPVPPEGAEVAGLPRAATPWAETSGRASTQRATFHVDSARSGWRSNETVLRPENVKDGSFGIVWESPQLDFVDGQAPRLYASPLYVDHVVMSAGPHRGAAFPVVIAASNNGFVYAVNAARRGDVAAGRILWRARLGAPCYLQPAPLDGVPTGILGTPVADVARGRLYVTHCDPKNRWQAYALDLASGQLLPGWPVRLDEATFNELNANAGPRRLPPTRRFDFRVQRGALNLSPDGSQLYVVFGETETGWLVAVDTHRAKVTSAFAAVAMPHRGSGGIWGAGGPAVDEAGNVYVVTGSGFDGYQDVPHDWAQSVLKLAHPGSRGFVLRGTYTPFNFCNTAKMDIDLGSGGVALLPPRPTGSKARLMAVGGKQGNVYLLDGERLPGRLDRRPLCTADSSRDGSLLPPGPQPHFGRRGPLNVFGPYSEEDAALDLARSRSVPATFRDASGVDHVFVTGNTKRAPGSTESVPPSLVRLQVVNEEGRAPYLRIDATARALVLKNPGSPVVTSHEADDALVWVLDENAPRSALLNGADAPRPVLYAVDARTLEVVWTSASGELFASGKYNQPAFGGGQVFVGTDRVQAFGLGGRRMADRPQSTPERASATEPGVARGQGAAEIYRQRCAICHDHPQGSIPPRQVIATRPRERIIHALTRGIMRPYAAGLSSEQVEEVTDYLRK